MGAGRSVESNNVGYTSFNTISNNPNNLVKLYSKSNFQGNIYEIDYGNYTSINFIDKLSPDNVFSLRVPSQTTIKLFSGDIYDYGGKGAVQITNVTNSTTNVPQLPDNIAGQVRSVIITKYDSSIASNVIDSSVFETKTISNLPPMTIAINEKIEQFASSTNYDNFIIALIVGLLIILLCNKYSND